MNTPVYRPPVWFPFYLFAVVGLVLLAAGCSALGLATADDLRAAADRMDDVETFAKRTAETLSAAPGWAGVLGSVASTVLAGGAGLSKYRNLTRATDPRVSNTARSTSNA